jgi:hypothetical protein
VADQLKIRAALCAAAGTVVALAPAANADPAAYGDQDAEFYRLLTAPQDANMTISNFALVRSQGLEACQREDQGVAGLDAVHALMAEGPYPFESASSIVSAAEVAYCPDNMPPEAGGSGS